MGQTSQLQYEHRDLLRHRTLNAKPQNALLLFEDMLKKPVLSAVCASKKGTFELAMRSIARQQQRTFTSSHRRNAQISHFTPASSAALDKLLAEISTKIILPSYLPEAQRKKIYSAKYEAALRSDPITIELDNEIIKFRYQNVLKDIPNTEKSLVSAISQFETDADFLNLKPLLEGLSHAGRAISDAVYAKIIRLTGNKGHIFQIIECALNVRRTAVKLDTSEKVNEVLHHVQMKACDAEFDEDVTKKAMRWAEMVVDMLYEEQHQPRLSLTGAGPLPGEKALNCDPMVLIAPLHLAAVLAGRHGAKEYMVKLRKYARSIVAYWPAGTKMMELQPAKLYEKQNKLAYLRAPNKFVTIATPLLHGLETAAEVLETEDPELASELQSRSSILSMEIEEARKDLEPERRGLMIYKRFYG
ncbi:hypothetical protein GGR50DRAFT_671454 [Xylaria sp. CBS 124048]|nr:hypothetical protein GGR50DRAFT_671454 [Xylaria sp. CBS 124048]